VSLLHAVGRRRHCVGSRDGPPGVAPLRELPLPAVWRRHFDPIYWAVATYPSHARDTPRDLNSTRTPNC
jgi:hypothetical protein